MELAMEKTLRPNPRCVFRRMFSPHFAPGVVGYRMLLNGILISTT